MAPMHAPMAIPSMDCPEKILCMSMPKIMPALGDMIASRLINELFSFIVDSLNVVSSDHSFYDLIVRS